MRRRAKKLFLGATVAFAFLTVVLGVVVWSSESVQRRVMRSWKLRPLMRHAYQIDTPRRIDSYLKAQPVRKLHIGCGAYRLASRGWLDTDIEPDINTAYLDATKRFPLPDSSIDYVFSEHMIEHISYEEGQFMMREVFRVLKPGGKVRTVTPNLSAFIALFDESHTADQQFYIREKLKFHGWPMTKSSATLILNLQMREWDHRFLYDPPTLREIHEQAGFTDLQEHRPGESGAEELRNIDYRPRREPQLTYYEAFAIEATKPQPPTT